MNTLQPMGPANRDTFQVLLGSRLNAGEVGVLISRAGVGKTACLANIALERVLQNIQVLHVGVDQTTEKIKLWYDELVKSMNAQMNDADKITNVSEQVEPLRFVLSYLNETFSVEKLEGSMLVLKGQLNFHPSLMLLDGLDFETLTRETIQELKDFAAKHEMSVWFSARSHRHIDTVNENGVPYPCNEIDDLFDAIVVLEPADDAIQLRLLKQYEKYKPDYPDVMLDPGTFLLRHKA